MLSNGAEWSTLIAPDLKERVMWKMLLDAAGRRRSPATMPGFHAGRPPRNKGRRYPADPPTVTEIIAVMRQAGDDLHGRRLRGLIVVLARGTADTRSARAQRGRPRPTTRIGARPPRQGRAPASGRHGRLGLGTTRALAEGQCRSTGRAAVLRD